MIIRNRNFVCDTESGHFTVSLTLVDLHRDKILLSLSCQECHKCIDDLESKQWKFKFPFLQQKKTDMIDPEQMQH